MAIINNTNLNGNGDNSNFNNIIEIKNVTKEYDGKLAVKDETISIKRGEFVTFLGPSGCGKTTTLRMIAGFEMPTRGKIYFEGKDITNIPPHLRKVNTVFQRYALFPHLNVFNNIAFGLKLKMVPDGTTYTRKGKTYQNMRKLTKAEITEKVNRALKMVDLEDYGHRDVDSLSGGQQQRVAIARAIVNEPKVLLLDEPLGALDLKMRKDMQIELMDMHKNLGITFVYVTHDQEEALTMSDKIVIMKDGEVQQIGTPKKIYDEPANAFVADFVGESNIFSGTMIDDYKVKFIGYEFECVDYGFKPNEPVDVIVRPEDIYITKGNAVEKAMFTAVVTSSIFKGDHYEIIAEANGNEFQIVENTECFDNEKIGIFINPDEIHIMHKDRIINEYFTTMNDDGKVEICEHEFFTNSKLPAETSVKVSIPFKNVKVFDYEEDGAISANVVSSIFKGSYYQIILRTDYDYDFFVDSEYDMIKGARVGISFNPEDIYVEAFEDK